MKTIEEIYAAINPLPAMLSAKGRKQPRANIDLDANSTRVTLWLKWMKEHNPEYSGQQEFKGFFADSVEEAVAQAIDLINNLSSMKEENTHAFMRDLGKLIDTGRDIGIEIEFLNPLTETMRRLSENALTHQPISVEVDTKTALDNGDLR